MTNMNKGTPYSRNWLVLDIFMTTSIELRLFCGWIMHARGRSRSFNEVITMATEVEASLSKLFSQLQIAGDDGDYEWGLEVSEKILKLIPDDKDAQLCQIVSLIQLGEYEDAINAINRLSKVEGHQVCLYEKAYCMYKLEKYRQSLDTLMKLPSEEQSSIRVLDLTSQIYYRLEEYTKSAHTFQKAKNVSDSHERSANMVAALSFCEHELVSTILSECPVVEETMEICFNLATAYLNAYGDHAHLIQAIDLLRTSEKLCEEAIANSPDDEDTEQELIPVHIQLAYALQCQGGHTEYDQALGMYSSVLKQKPSSAVHSMTAANNVIVLNRDKDIFDSKKKIKLISNEQSMKKLNSKQKAVILFNRCIFALQINQLEQCRQLLQEFKMASPNAEEVVLVEAALMNRERKFSESWEIMDKYLESNSCSILFYLTLGQFYSSQGNHTKVCQVFEKIPYLARYLGIVSILLAYYASTGATRDIQKLLSSVIEYWKDRSDVLFADKEKVFWAIGLYNLQHDCPADAAGIFEYLYKQDKSNVKVLAYLISAYSRYNTQKAEELGRKLSQSYPSSLSIDVDALEQMPSFRHTRRQVAKSEVSRKEADSDRNKVAPSEKKKKKRKPRLPKNYDPSKQPDPERWLPLRERSYYKKSKKKGQQTGIGRGTQGLSAASASLAAKLDASNKPMKMEEPKEQQTSSAKPKGNPAGGQHHKKKKKGRR